ncbi:MAG: 1-acyl-sn-glycerol-3-phosphate acyltransferase [Oscillospiraceae bacterium]|nr:1-acyl-sn-glycerol-3-phosphate acyltransferase [Oscillospiraceae bacterium]
MVIVLSFAGFSLICFILLLFVFSVSVFPAFFLSLGIFLLLHLLYILFFWAVSASVPLDQPIQKQSRLCRLGLIYGAAAINFYGGIKAHLSGVEKLPSEGRFLFICNHRSMFDPLIVIDKLRKYNISFVSKPSNMKIPVAGRVVYSVGFLPIDRENNRNALKTILTASDYMKRDICSIGIYPEGTRSKTKEMLPFHAGCLKAAQRASVPIVVACVRGTENAQRMKFLSMTAVSLDILEVIPADTVCSMKTDALSRHIRETIQACLDSTERDT